MQDKVSSKQLVDSHEVQIRQHERDLGPEHPAIGRACIRLAMLCFDTGDVARASQLLGRAQSVCSLWQGRFGRDPGCMNSCFHQILQGMLGVA
jgi:hypothetical protein